MSIITYGAVVHRSEVAAAELAREGILVEIIDLRSSALTIGRLLRRVCRRPIGRSSLTRIRDRGVMGRKSQPALWMSYLTNWMLLFAGTLLRILSARTIRARVPRYCLKAATLRGQRAISRHIEIR